MKLQKADTAALVTVAVDNGVGVLTLNHPPLNIINRAVLDALHDGLKQLGRETQLRALLVSAAGRHFSAGADVGEHLPPHDRVLIERFMEMIRVLVDFPLPVVAAVKGRCLGGGFEIVQAADIVVAGEGALFGQPEIVLGVPAPAACALLPELCAPGVAAELVFTGEPMSAHDALRAGLVARVVPDESVDDEARGLTSKMTRHSAAALRLTKRALRLGSAARRKETLHAAEVLYLAEVMKTEDAPEGLRAFLEKRRPVWKHR